MIKTHQCPKCNKWIVLLGKLAEYYDDMMFHAPKLRFLCSFCAMNEVVTEKLDYYSSGKLLAIQGADYIDDFGIVDF